MLTLALVAIAIIVVGGVLMLVVVLHDVPSSERPAILRAFAECIRALRGPPRR